MKQILDDLDLVYTEADDEAAFYGPKLDIQTTNVYGKEDTLISPCISPDASLRNSVAVSEYLQGKSR